MLALIMLKQKPRILEYRWLVDFFDGLKTILFVKGNSESPPYSVARYKLTQYRRRETHTPPINGVRQYVANAALIPTLVLVWRYVEVHENGVQG